jgi:homoserine dehydrogenase
MSFRDDHVRTIPVLPIDEISTRYYIRFTTMDRPGVLSTISGILGKYDISLKSVQQPEDHSERQVPIIMVSAPAKESDMKKAVAEINTKDIITGETVIIRIGADSHS